MNLLDRVVSAFSPQAGLRRALARRQIERLRQYDGGRLDRSTAAWLPGPTTIDGQELGEIIRLQARAWDLWRNNVYFRKAVRAMTAQIIGRGMFPDPKITHDDGRLNSELQQTIRTLFRQWSRSVRFGFIPGGGVCEWEQIQQLCFRDTAIGGEILIRKRFLSTSEAKRKGLQIPLQLELIEGERLDEGLITQVRTEQGTVIHRGVEFNVDSGERIAYHIRDHHPQSVVPTLNFRAKRIPARDIIHLYMQERPSQIRGVSWFAPTATQFRDIADYQENELMASAVAACFSVAIKLEPNAGELSLATPTGQDSNDADSNPITRIQPGTIMRLRPGEDVSTINPSRESSQTERFANHLLRGLALGMPGLKASTVTGDYRESSFSSERSADNDVWRENEQNQQWFQCSFCNPIWDWWLRALELSGILEGVDFDELRDSPVSWSSPVVKSINPADDAEAASLRVANGSSSTPIEAGALGEDWLENLDATQKVVDEARARNLPEEFVLGLLGITVQAQVGIEANGAKPQQPNERERTPVG